MKIKNAFSIDVEDYFQVAAFDKIIQPSAWPQFEIRVERNVDTLLAMLATHRAQATFFTLGWVAERFPQMVKRIVAGGHELASHGYGHQKITSLSVEQFREDVVRAKGILEDLGGLAIRGYRAPSFSIGASNLWAHDVLLETGHAYSSSVYPVKTDHYGMPEAPRFAWKSKSGLVEIPPSSIRLAGRNLPASGGGYFRLLPLSMSRWSFNQVNKEGEAAIFYCHPWEIDPGQPRMKNATLKSRFRHYVNLSTNEKKISDLLANGAWGRMDEVFKAHLPQRAN